MLALDLPMTLLRTNLLHHNLFASWSLDSDDDWQHPLHTQTMTKVFLWDEDVYQADNSKGWVEVE